MQTDLSTFDSASCFIERGGEPVIPNGVLIEFYGFENGLSAGGHFIVECFDKDGNFKWEDTAENAVTGVGLDHILNIVLGAGTQITTWYIGLVDNAGFTAFASGDTSASHSGWSEAAGSDYSQSTRPSWSPSTSSGGAGSVSNSSTVNFSMTNSSSLTIKGLFLISDNTKAGTSGVLFSTAAFTSGTQATNSGDTLKITYTVSATSS